MVPVGRQWGGGGPCYGCKVLSVMSEGISRNWHAPQLGDGGRPLLLFRLARREREAKGTCSAPLKRTEGAMGIGGRPIKSASFPI